MEKLPKELKGLVESLDELTKGIVQELDVDFDDEDDEKLGSGFKVDSMYNQLGKVLDSQGNPNPVDKVTTDDGDEFSVTADQARILRMLATTDKVKPMVRDKFLRDIQTSNGLSDFLDIKDYHEISQLFVKRYLG